MSTPCEEAGSHVGAIAYPEQQGPLRPVGVLMELARRMHHEGAGRHLDLALGRAHPSTAGKAEIDLSRRGVAMVGADLAGLPASDGDVAAGDLPENLLDMLCGIELLLPLQAEHLHVRLFTAAPGAGKAGQICIIAKFGG